MRPEPVRGDGVFAPAAFERDDDAPDDRFYALARKVVHIDDGAIAALGRLYAEVNPDREGNGGCADQPRQHGVGDAQEAGGIGQIDQSGPYDERNHADDAHENRDDLGVLPQIAHVPTGHITLPSEGLPCKRTRRQCPRI